MLEKKKMSTLKVFGLIHIKPRMENIVLKNLHQS